MNREELKWFPQKPKCEGGVGGFVSIGLTECRYALAMFGYGVLLAIIIFCCEIILKIMHRMGKRMNAYYKGDRFPPGVNAE